MTEAVTNGDMPTPTLWDSPAMRARIRRRYRNEWLFRATGLVALVAAVAFLLFLLFDIVSTGWTSFQQTEVQVSLTLDPAALGLADDAPPGPERLRVAPFDRVVAAGARAAFGDGAAIVSDGAWLAVRRQVAQHPEWLGTRRDFWLIAGSAADQWNKHGTSEGAIATDMALLRQLRAEGRIRTIFNRTFFTSSDSVDPEMAGIRGGLVGSFLTLLVTLAFCCPAGILAAIYLEEFGKGGRGADFLEVSINNLAAVPSIIFGLLGLAVFLNIMHLPRSAPLVGGLTLALMTLPVIVITTRAALKSVPPSVRIAALGIGASKVQVIFHHVLPLAVPGILTGTILGLARAMGETAPLLLIGMRAFLTSVPGSIAQPSTLLPVQVFMWSDNVDPGFVEKTSGAILVLLLFLLTMNALAVYLRNRFEVRW